MPNLRSVCGSWVVSGATIPGCYNTRMLRYVTIHFRIYEPEPGLEYWTLWRREFWWQIPFDNLFMIHYQRNIFWRWFSSNFEAFASELLENHLEEIFLHAYLHSDMLSMVKSSTTHLCVIHRKKGHKSNTFPIWDEMKRSTLCDWRVIVATIFLT